MGPNPMTGVLIRGQNIEDTDMGECHVGTNIGVMLPPAKGCQGFPEPPEARREEWNQFSLELPIGSNPADFLILDI